jgi:Cu+-exporting ATPase
VVEARVNLASEKAYITYNPRITSLENLRKAVEVTGYQYLGIAGEEAASDLEKKAQEKDLKDKFRRMTVGFAVSLFLMDLMYLPLDRIIPMDVLMAVPMSYPMLVISTPPFIYVSYPIFKAAARALRNRNLNMDVMYSMGIGVAYVSSLMGTFQDCPDT